MELKEIPGFPRYFAGTDGKIYSNTRNNMRPMSPYMDRYGYLALKPRINGKMKTQGVHRLLALAFIPNPENKPQVNHKNGIKTDNRIENLEWATESENVKHAFDHGLVSARRGEDSNFSSITEEIAHEVCKLLEDRKLKDWEIMERLGVTRSVVSHMKGGSRWTHVSKNYDIPEPRSNSRQLPKEQVIDICGLLNAGHKPKEISDELGFKFHTVSQIAYRARYKSISKDYLY